MQRTSLWHWIAGDGSILHDFAGYVVGSVCLESEDGYHHATSYVKDKGNGYYTAICSACGKKFEAYESDLNQSYQQQVSTLPAPGYNSAGRLIWQPSFSDIDFNNCAVSVTDSFNGFGSLPYSNILLDLSFDSTENALKLIATPSSFYSSYTSACVQLSFVLPIDGSYCLTDSLRASVRAVSTDGVASERSYFYKVGSFLHYSKGNTFSLNRDRLSYGLSGSYSTAVSYWYFPVYEVIPDTAIDTTPGGQYNITTRPTTITGGNYGIVGDDNNITTVTNTTQIVNEGDNLYYNPATGQTQTITDWTYNYDGRIYDITLDTGDKVSVEYGDENITITENTVNEGDTIVNNYTIYYMIDGSGSGDNPDPSPGPTVCPHEWYKTGERQATCLVPAQRTYTCSVCGEQKTETDPVLGHSWHAIQTVTTQYDDNGNQTQEGYTIYECERCGEQYKSTNNAGPLSSGGGGSGGGTSENIFTGIFSLIWDFFTFLFDLFSEFVVGGIKGFIDGLKDAGSSFFSILNPFDWGY